MWRAWIGRVTVTVINMSQEYKKAKGGTRLKVRSFSYHEEKHDVAWIVRKRSNSNSNRRVTRRKHVIQRGNY